MTCQGGRARLCEAKHVGIKISSGHHLTVRFSLPLALLANADLINLSMIIDIRLGKSALKRSF